MYCSISPPSYSGMLDLMGLFYLPVRDTFMGRRGKIEEFLTI